MSRARDLADFNFDGKAVTINESSADLDFRVESDNLDDALFVQGSDGIVGVGTKLLLLLLATVCKFTMIQAAHRLDYLSLTIARGLLHLMVCS